MLRTCIRDENARREIAKHGSAARQDCEVLIARLRDPATCQMSPEAIDTHVRAVEALQNMFDTENAAVSANLGNLAALQDWLISIPPAYVESLNQRRPESLVVLAYYCVLLHRGAEYWFVSDLGKRLIELIDEHLGPFWGEWLAWPKMMSGTLV